MAFQLCTDQSSHPVRVAVLYVELGRSLRITVKPKQATAYRVNSSVRLQWKDITFDTDFTPCAVVPEVGGELCNGHVLAPRGFVADTMSEVLVVHQRGEGSLSMFLSQWLGQVEPALIQEPTGRAIDPRHTKGMLPAGSCLVCPPTADFTFRWSIATETLMRQSNTFAGWARSLQSHWQWCSFNPGSNDPSLVVTLDPGNWGVAPSEPWVPTSGPDGDILIVSSFRVDDNELTDLFSAMSRDEKSFAVSGVNVPLLPSTVCLDADWHFCSAVRFVHNQNPKKEEPNLSVFLRLQRSRSWSAFSLAGTSCDVLARFEGWCDSNPHLGEVASPSAKELEEADLKSLTTYPSWRVYAAPGNAPKNLRVGLLNPGFVRKAHSAFYSRLKEGDLVVVRIRDGQLPLVLGSLHVVREEYEQDGAAELVLSGESIAARAVQSNGESAETELLLAKDGKVKIVAKESFEALGSLMLTKDKLAAMSSFELTQEDVKILDAMTLTKDEFQLMTSKAIIDGELNVGK